MKGASQATRIVVIETQTGGTHRQAKDTALLTIFVSWFVVVPIFFIPTTLLNERLKASD